MIETNNYATVLYDADGNMVLYNGWTLGWDDENRLKQAVKYSTNISYACDALKQYYMGGEVTYSRFCIIGYLKALF